MPLGNYNFSENCVLADKFGVCSNLTLIHKFFVMAIAKNIDEYIAAFTPAIQKLLQQMRKTIQKAAPKAEETINYGIPTFTLNGNLVHFAGYKNHIGFYPAPSGILAFKKELSVYAGAKGSVQFPVDKPLPLDLVKQIVQFRVAENIEKANRKKVAKASTKALSNARKSTLQATALKEKTSYENNFLFTLGAPAKRALQNKGIQTLQKLSAFTEKEILQLHGIGPSSIPKLKSALQSEGLSFKK